MISDADVDHVRSLRGQLEAQEPDMSEYDGSMAA